MTSGKSCRVCLGNDELTNIFRLENTAEKLTCFANVKVEKNDGLPQYICLLCKHELDICVSFKEKCESTYQILKQNSNENIVRLKDKVLLNALVNRDQVEGKFLEESKKRLLENVKENLQNRKRIKVYNVSKGVNKFEILPLKNIHLINNVRSQHKNLEFENSFTYLPDEEEMSLVEREEFECQSQVGTEEWLTTTDFNTENRVCAICNLVFTSEIELNIHVESKHASTKQQCQICLALYPDESTIRDHLKQKHDIELEPDVFSCKICGEDFKLQNELNGHLCEKKNSFDCVSYRSELNHSSDLESHVTEFHEIASVKCTLCNGRYREHEELRSHMKVHNRVQYKCDICGKTLKTCKALKVHKKNHTNQQECEICDTYFAHRQNLIIHMKTVHNLASEDRRDVKEESGNCEECGKKCKESSIENKRIGPQNGSVYPHVCPFCEKIFKTFGGIECHVKIHTEKKMPPRLFTCYVCGDTFPKHSDLRGHSKTHENGSPYTHIVVYERGVTQ